MNSRVLVPLMPLLMACIVVDGDLDDGNGDDSTSGDGDGDPTGDGDGDGDPTGDGDGDPTGDGDGDGDMWCGLEDGLTRPSFTLAHMGAPLEAGGELRVECGFQGSFMIEIDPALGGFIPESEYVDFHVTLDVEGFNLGPNNLFAESDIGIYVGCCEDGPYGYECSYVTRTFQLFPPDMIDDMALLHDAPAHLEVTMTTPEGPVTQALDVQMWAVQEGTEWEFCEYEPYYPVFDPLSLAPIPQAGR